MKILLARNYPGIQNIAESKFPSNEYFYYNDEISLLEGLGVEGLDVVALLGTHALRVFWRSGIDKNIPLILLGRDLFCSRKELVSDGCNIVNDRVILEAADFERVLREYSPKNIESL